MWTEKTESTLPQGVRLEQLSSDQLFPRFSKEPRFDHVLAVDSVYHMDKHQVLGRNSGKSAYSDFVAQICQQVSMQ